MAPSILKVTCTCIFPLSGILADFILQATLFTALLAIDARRYRPCYYSMKLNLVRMEALKC